MLRIEADWLAPAGLLKLIPGDFMRLPSVTQTDDDAVHVPAVLDTTPVELRRHGVRHAKAQADRAAAAHTKADAAEMTRIERALGRRTDVAQRGAPSDAPVLLASRSEVARKRVVRRRFLRGQLGRLELAFGRKNAGAGAVIAGRVLIAFTLEATEQAGIAVLEVLEARVVTRRSRRRARIQRGGLRLDRARGRPGIEDRSFTAKGGRAGRRWRAARDDRAQRIKDERRANSR